MGWIKRNLFIVIGGAVALVLLGAGGFYNFQSWTRNSEASTKLGEIYSTLKNLQSQSPAPGNEKVNNTETAKQQERVVQEWIATSRKYFQPIPTIPAGNVTSEAFASALRKTVDLLQREAENAGVTLPPKYDFSFSAQRPLVQFAVGSLEPLSVQLGEVKAISECIFSARVNAIDTIQRIRVSQDDINGSQSDYTDRQSTTNELAVMTPYVITFRCFTPELARVIGAFAASSHAMVINKINIQPAGMATTALAGGQTLGMMPGRLYGDTEMPPGYPSPGYPSPGYPPSGYPTPGYPSQAPAAQPVPGKGGLQTVLKEQLLRVTMEVELIKLLPKS
jgi:hypothetical protein